MTCCEMTPENFLDSVLKQFFHRQSTIQYVCTSSYPKVEEALSNQSQNKIHLIYFSRLRSFSLQSNFLLLASLHDIGNTINIFVGISSVRSRCHE